MKKVGNTIFQFTDDLSDLLRKVESEEDEDEFRGVKPENYIPELEEKVAHWMAITPNRRLNTIKHERIKIPKSWDSPAQKRAFVLEERRRCIEGYNGICGKMYFYFNYCKMQNLSSGRISPQYREVDNEWFKYLETLTKTNEWGIICVKRRRVGMSWKAAADVVHDIIFFSQKYVGMNSKSEIDSQLLLAKVNFILDELPEFFQLPKLSDASNKIFIGYKVTLPNGVKITKGNRSTAEVVAPTDRAYEGRMLSKWISDEAGKIKNLRSMWTLTEDCLFQETRRVGIPIIFGTSGDVGKEGKDLKEMWRDAEIYRLKRFFIAGWDGLNVDEYGNDNKEECIRWIIYKRYELSKAGDTTLLNTFIQKYPLCIDDAFNYTDGGGIGYRERIVAHLASLRENPAEKRTGAFRRNLQGEVEFVPDPRGKCIIYEHPKSQLKNLYIAGIDPADHDDVNKEESSDLSMFIMKRMHGLEPPKVVFEYTDRPDKAEDFYDQAIMALVYYNECKALIENNRYRMISELDTKGFKRLLATTPTGITRLFGTRANTPGIRMTPAIKDYLRQLLQEYTKLYCEIIPSEELLEEFMFFGVKNTDKAMAFGICLIYMKENKQLVYKQDEGNPMIPTFGYKLVNGKIMRYDRKLA